MYRTLLACLRNIVNFWSKITIKYDNEVNAELKVKVTERAIAFLKIEEAARREDSSNGGQADQLHRRCQFF
jgi:hypothetical protein